MGFARDDDGLAEEDEQSNHIPNLATKNTARLSAIVDQCAEDEEDVFSVQRYIMLDAFAPFFM